MSRGVVIEAKIADASGRAAMLEALEVELAQEARIFARMFCSMVVDPELGNNAVQIPEVCHVGEILKVIDDEQRARTWGDRPPELGEMSLAEVGLALKSHLPAPRSEPAALVVNFVLRHSGLEWGEDIERHSPLSALVLPHSG